MPGEARQVVLSLTAAEIVLAFLLAWVLVNSGVPRHASQSPDIRPGDLAILLALLGCLALHVFVLAVWQWRLRGRDRVRILLACYMSQALAFCGLCWYDVSVRTAELVGAAEPRALLCRVVEQTAAAGLTLGSLLVGLVALMVILRLARRSLNRVAPDVIVRGT